MKTYGTDRRSMNIIRTAVFLTAGALSAVCFALIRFVPILMFSLGLIFALVGIFVSFIYLPIYFGSLAYTLSDGKIEKKSGFYFKKTQTVKLDSIQYTSLIHTPFSKFTGMNFLNLYAYGGMMNVIFMKKNDFEELSELIKKSYKERTEKSERQ